MNGRKSTTVYLIRHCEAEGNLYRRIHGLFDSAITEKGARQLQALAARLAAVPFAGIYASELSRARHTAESIARGLPVRVDRGLNERSMGIWEDYSWHEIEQRHPAEFAAWRADPRVYSIPGGEAEAAAGARFEQALWRIAADHPGKTIAVVAHSMVIRALQNKCFAGQFGEAAWGENTSVSVLEVNGGKICFTVLNDACHLNAGLSTAHREQAAGYGLARYSLQYRETDADTKPGNSAFAGYDGDDVVGFVELSLSPGLARVHRLYVESRFRRQGFGSQLLGEALVRLRRAGGGYLEVTQPSPDGVWHAFCTRNALCGGAGVYTKQVPACVLPVFCGA